MHLVVLQAAGVCVCVCVCAYVCVCVCGERLDEYTRYLKTTNTDNICDTPT